MIPVLWLAGFAVTTLREINVVNHVFPIFNVSINWKIECNTPIFAIPNMFPTKQMEPNGEHFEDLNTFPPRFVLNDHIRF